MQTGQHLQFETISTDEVYEGEVISAESLISKAVSGTLANVNVDGYGETKILFPGGDVTADGAKHRMQRCGLPSQFSGVRWNDFRWSVYGENMGASREFRASQKFIFNTSKFLKNGMGLYFLGRVSGCGKSMLLSVLANEVLQRHDFSVKYVTQNDYFSLLRTDEQAKKAEARAIQNCVLLFLDDLKSISGSQWYKDVLKELIEKRVRQGHVTVYASKEPVEKLNIDEGTVDLIAANAIGLKLPDVPVRKMLSTDRSAKFEKKLFEG